jgi:hypothetical protein
MELLLPVFPEWERTEVTVLRLPEAVRLVTTVLDRDWVRLGATTSLRVLGLGDTAAREPLLSGFRAFVRVWFGGTTWLLVLALVETAVLLPGDASRLLVTVERFEWVDIAVRVPLLSGLWAVVLYPDVSVDVYLRFVKSLFALSLYIPLEE